MIAQHQSSMREYSSCLAARGLIFNGRPGGSSSNSSGVGRGWRPLHKPQWFDVNKKVICKDFSNIFISILQFVQAMAFTTWACRAGTQLCKQRSHDSEWRSRKLRFCTSLLPARLLPLPNLSLPLAHVIHGEPCLLAMTMVFVIVIHPDCDQI